MGQMPGGRGLAGPFPALALMLAVFLTMVPQGAWAASRGPAGAGTPFTQVPPPPRLSARAAVLMDWQTGQVLYEKNAHERRSPASTTKILTAMVALERGRLTDQVKVSRRAAGTPGSSMQIRAGEVYTLHDLLKGLLIRSGNDAAVAIAEHIAGSVEAFSELMNEKARALGARNSRFLNPHGLTRPGHYSTAYDLALMTRQALRHPVIADLIRRQKAEVGTGSRRRTIWSTNKLLAMYPGADGVKTGTTQAAGPCLVASATRPHPDAEGELQWKLIAVVLNARARWQDSAELLSWGFNHFRPVQVAQAGDALTDLPVDGGLEPRVAVTGTDAVGTVVPREAAAAPELVFRVPSRIAAPVPVGHPVGAVEVWWNGHRQRVVPLVTAAPVERGTWFTRTVRPLLPLLRWLDAQGWL